MAKPDAPDRLVLFFDTHEAFYGRERNFAVNFFRDSWLRRLLRKLELTQGIIVVVAGRDRPRWAEADEYELNTKIPEDYIYLKSVDNLAATDALAYLQKVDISDDALHESIVTYASLKEDEVHPLYLGLCADVILEARAKGISLTSGDFQKTPELKVKSEFLINKLLKYTDSDIKYAIHALSACREFDFQIYQLLGENLEFTTDRPTFEHLIGFSFIKHIEQAGKISYRIHDLLRRLDDNPRIEASHRLLTKYYKGKNDFEAIYHVNQLDSEQGINQWLNAFHEALGLSQYNLCRALLDIRRDLVIKEDFDLGQISYAEGQYFQDLASYIVSQQKYVEAIEAYSQTLKKDPNNTTTLLCRGNALSESANVYFIQANYDCALSEYKAAISDYNRALELIPENFKVLNNKAVVLEKLASLQTTLSKYQDSIDTYNDVIDIYEHSLNINPNDITTLNNHSWALTNVANLHTMLSQYPSAQVDYERALDTYKRILSIEENHFKALSNKGLTLRGLARLRATCSQHDEAISLYAEAINAFDMALSLNLGDNTKVPSNKGLALQGLADLMVEKLCYEEAHHKYEEAVRIYKNILTIAQDDVTALSNEASALQSLANLQIKQLKYDSAQETYQDAIDICNRVLAITPCHIKVLKVKSNVFRGFADFLAKKSQDDEAVLYYEKAINICDQALQYTPNHIDILIDKGAALGSLANLQANQLTRDADFSYQDYAMFNYQQTITAYDNVLQYAPDSINALNNKGVALIGMATLHAESSQQSCFLDCLKEALKLLKISLRLAPNDVYIRQHYNVLTQFLASELN